MYKKVITYENYDGEERTMDAYFNMTEAEVMEFNFAWDGGLNDFLKKMVDEKDQKRLIEFIKILILKSYGERSLDGNRFIKTPEITEAFTQTPAYSEMFMMLATDDQEASNFVNGIIPKKLRDRAEKAQAEGKLDGVPASITSIEEKKETPVNS